MVLPPGLIAQKKKNKVITDSKPRVLRYQKGEGEKGEKKASYPNRGGLEDIELQTNK